MDRKTNESIKTFASLARKTFKADKIILFGSYAKGNNRDDSDIDIAVVVNDIQGDFLELSANLFGIVRSIDARIEPVLVDGRNDKSGFLEGITKYGIAY